MTQPKVSVIIPVYNKENFVISSLSSVIFQSFTDWELIIVDDGSTDQSVKKIKSFIQENALKCLFLEQPNLGASSAKNLGMANATGEYIAFLDADDLWLPNKLELQCLYMDKHEDVQITLTNYIIFNKGKHLRLRAIRSTEVNKLVKRWLEMRGFGGCTSTLMLRRKSLANNLLFNENLETSEDLDFIIRWNLAYKIKVISRFTTLYRVSSGQLHMDTEATKRNVRLVHQRYMKLIPNTGRAIEYQRAYFLLSPLRKLSVGSALKCLILLLSKGDWVVFELLFWIILRNIKSKFVSFRKRSEVLRLLNRLPN